ncbi:hypothetical protein LTR36_002155 [Oleoguttula mirabilis]|uniref:Uncharacterized protein n=1 Tax=Oleoguttula mirabilis TaxID=1507867 RepID=A0AAV9JL57_9PEZI|nr:hypothetical protein LTR36_002155 [Oleoguttula mirabilis]
MARTSRRMQAFALLVLAAAPLANAASTLTEVSDSSTVTDTTATTSATSAASTTDSTTDSTTTTSDTITTTSDTTTATSDATTTTSATTTTDASSSTDTASFISSTSSGTATTTTSGLTDLPTLAGAGIPTLVVPYTASAPFMQKSSYPEGTVFIAVGAVLAFLGACVLLWRVMVAWSINRSVKRSAMASIRGSEKNSTWGGSSGHQPAKGGLYKDGDGSSMSLDALTSTGKPVKPHFREHEVRRESTPPHGLFFSPTAQPGGGAHNNRNSAYLPAGYYASPSAQAAGGAGSTTIGGSLAPYARHSSYGPSPPDSPGLPPTSRGSGNRGTSRDGLRSARDGLASSRNSYLDGTPRQGHSSALYAQPSSSSLMVGTGGEGHSSDNLGGSRAPSAYLEDLFENHGSGPRERF